MLAARTLHALLQESNALQLSEILSLLKPKRLDLSCTANISKEAFVSQPKIQNWHNCLSRTSNKILMFSVCSFSLNLPISLLHINTIKSAIHTTQVRFLYINIYIYTETLNSVFKSLNYFPGKISFVSMRLLLAKTRTHCTANVSRVRCLIWPGKPFWLFCACFCIVLQNNKIKQQETSN